MFKEGANLQCSLTLFRDFPWMLTDVCELDVLAFIFDFRLIFISFVLGEVTSGFDPESVAKSEVFPCPLFVDFENDFNIPSITILRIALGWLLIMYESSLETNSLYI